MAYNFLKPPNFQNCIIKSTMSAPLNMITRIYNFKFRKDCGGKWISKFANVYHSNAIVRLKKPHHPLRSTTPPSSRYHTTLFKVPHHPLRGTTHPLQSTTSLFEVTHHPIQSTIPMPLFDLKIKLPTSIYSSPTQL